MALLTIYGLINFATPLLMLHSVTHECRQRAVPNPCYKSYHRTVRSDSLIWLVEQCSKGADIPHNSTGMFHCVYLGSAHLCPGHKTSLPSSYANVSRRSIYLSHSWHHQQTLQMIHFRNITFDLKHETLKRKKGCKF